MSKIRLACYNDESTGRWGEQLHQFAMANRQRRFDSVLFQANDPPLGPIDYYFIHVHNSPAWIRKDKHLHNWLCNLVLAHGGVVIPDARWIQWYDDKAVQVSPFKQWMPRTELWQDADPATWRFPLLMKRADGSSSKYVWLCENEGQVINAAKAGAVVVQEFLPNNAFDYRVVSCGRYRMVLQRFNRPDVPFASGSGRWEPIFRLSGEIESVLEFSDEIFITMNLPWCGLDIVRDHANERWRLLEVTTGWKLRVYYDCVWFEKFHGDISGYGWMTTSSRWTHGVHTWPLLVDEIANGAFK